MPSYLVSAKEAFVPTELYTPPIESIGEILRIKQGRYDQGFNQVNSQFLNIRDAEILSQHGNAKRQQFMQQADAAIKQLSTVDLSLPENVAMGENVFKPFWQDQRLVKEIGTIRNTNKELSYAESLRTSTDEKTRAMYNPYSVKDQQNLLKEIAESTPEEIDRIGPRAYAKNVDIIKEMDDAIKNLGITNAQVREMPNGGGYKIVNQFGKESVLPLTDFFMSSLTTDARAYLQTMGRVAGRNDFEIALQQTNGDKVAARNMVAEELINKQRNSIEKNIIPEFNNAIGDAENKINAIISKRKAAGSQLSEEDLASINEYKEAILGYRKKVEENTSLVNGLGDKTSEIFARHKDVYATTNGYGDAYTSQIVGNFANGWAKSRAQWLGSQKVEADQAWKNIEDVTTARMNIQAGLLKTDQTNDIRLQIAEMNAAAKAKKAGGTGSGAGTTGVSAPNQPIYLGRSVTGNKPIDKFTQWATGYSIISDMVGNSSMRLFEKTLNTRAGLDFTTQLYEGVQKGMGDKPFFTAGKDTPQYKAFKKAIDDGILKMEPGRVYKWTYDEVYDFINKNTQNYMQSADGIQAIKNLNLAGQFDNDAKAVLAGGRLYNAMRDEQSQIYQKILSNDKYKGFVTSEGGIMRLKTEDDLAIDGTIPMRDENGNLVNISVKDLAANSDNMNITRDAVRGVVYGNPASSSYTTTVNINGKTYTKYSTNNEMQLIKDGKLDQVTGSIDPEKSAKLAELKKQFDKEFDQMAPGLMFSQNSPNADMLNHGSLLYASGDKNSLEAGEQAAIQLLSQENLSNRFKKFVGVDPSDLKDGSAFMTVINAVSANLPKLALSETGNALRVDPYNSEIGGPAYKIILDRKQITDALGMTAEQIEKKPEIGEAINKFISNEFLIAAPDNLRSPGAIVTGYSPMENYIRQKGFKTEQYLDDLKVGGFHLNKLTNGGFQLNTWHYELNPQTNTMEPVNTPMGTIDQAVDVMELTNRLYDMLFSNYKNTVAAENTANKVNGTISLSNTVDELRKLGIKIN